MDAMTANTTPGHQDAVPTPPAAHHSQPRPQTPHLPPATSPTPRPGRNSPARAPSTSTHPVNTAAIRWNIGLLLPHHQALPLTDDELAALTDFLRTQTQLLIAQVEQAAARRPTDDVPRYIALACTAKARNRLSAQAGPGRHDLLVHARRLARALAALCDHHDALADVAMCLACDQPLHHDDQTIPYDHVSPSGSAARAGHIHTRCVNTVRRNR
ncbi:DUF6415 family natural product biosynthesis protein [Streptomyces sp. NPDC059766]|uniref:DUF6415 family natural product biosynthesis protein n=1 Tax=Streptomyces sp. NPDC059766 TaxID=3346940 RepID=UPI00364F0290